jgi:hypothetical protein
VQHRRFGLDRRDPVDHCRQRLIDHLDQLGGVARELGGLGQHGDHRLTHVTGLADRHAVVAHQAGGLGCHLEERLLQLTDLRPGERRVDTRQRLRVRDVDRHDPRVGVRRADEVDVALAVHPEVVDERPLAFQQPLVLLARHALARPHAEPIALLDLRVEGGLACRCAGLACRCAHCVASAAAAAASIERTMFT